MNDIHAPVARWMRAEMGACPAGSRGSRHEIHIISAATNEPAWFNMAFSGVFNLPNAIWGWWTVEGFLAYPLGGLVLGWFVGKFGSD